MRILIAEDDPVIGLGLAARLRHLGHTPLGPATDGLEAVEKAHSLIPDLYLFDIDMPKLDGLAAAATLAAAGLRRPVVVVTGVEDDTDTLIDRSITTGVAAYLRKPVNEQELDAAIRIAAARHAELEGLEAEVQEAHHALDDRKIVERAKGLLMQTLSLSEPEAFARIQTLARNRNTKLVDVARSIIENRALFDHA